MHVVGMVTCLAFLVNVEKLGVAWGRGCWFLRYCEYICVYIEHADTRWGFPLGFVVKLTIDGFHVIIM